VQRYQAEKRIVLLVMEDDHDDLKTDDGDMAQSWL
jgi:hypothetical protein